MSSHHWGGGDKRDRLTTQPGLLSEFQVKVTTDLKTQGPEE